MTEIHFNRLTFPSFAFYRWTANTLDRPCPEDGIPGRIAVDLEPEVGLALRELLGDACPRSFHVEAEDAISAYGWGSDLENLEPTLSARIPGAAIVSRRLSPAHLEGHLRFRLRCSPTLRRGRREIDAWIAQRESGSSRNDAYRSWLAPRLAGAEIDALRIVRAGPVAIRLPGRAIFAKPSAILEGELVVTDPASLMTVLERGIGRHGRLGFGALILGRA